jgi:uncharacterized repeat protein (TIGR01451 family)
MANSSGAAKSFVPHPPHRWLGLLALLLLAFIGAGIDSARAQTVTITDGQTTYTPGQWVIYTVVVNNNTGGALAAGTRRVRMPAVSGLSISDIGCLATGTTCPTIDQTTQAAQITSLEAAVVGLQLPAMPTGSTVTLLVAGVFHANASGSISKTAAVTNNAGTTVINSATDSSSAINVPTFTSCPTGTQYLTWTGSGTTHTGSMTPPAGFTGLPNVTSTVGNSAGVALNAAESLTGVLGTDSMWTTIFGASPAGNVRWQVSMNPSPGGFNSPAIQTLSFASVVAANSWGLLLADNDVEQIRIEAFSGPNLTGTAYTPAQISSWYRGAYDQDVADGRDLPRWLPAVATSVGANTESGTNNAIPPGTIYTTDADVLLDSSRASLWFTPGAPVQSMRITYQNLGANPTARLYVAGCLEAQPQLRLQKSLPNGRAVTGNQFTLRIANGATILQSATTTGTTNTPTQVATLNPATAGTTYTLSEIGAGTPAAVLPNYTTTYSCTNALAGGQTPSGTGTSFDVTPVIGDNLTCAFTNTRKQATLTLTKISQGGARAFTFTGNNGWTSQTLTTTVPGVGVTGATQTLTALDTATTITETMPPGFVLSSVTCSGMGAGGTVTPGASSFVLNAAAVTADANIACTVTNSVQSQPVFPTCPSGMYLSQSPNSNTNTTLYDINTSTNPFTYPALGQGSNVYNAIGFNPVDNYIYGINSGGGTGNRLIRVGADGSTVDLGPVGGGMATDGWIMGTFSDTGVLYVLAGGGSTNLRAIDVQTNTSTLITLSSSVQGSDIAWIGGLIYTVQANGQLRSINPATGAVANIGSPSAAADYGAMFGSPTGLFGSSNTGGFYRFNLTTGARTLISGSPGATVNDGASCPTAPITFAADLAVTKTDGNDTYTPGTNVVYTITATNLGPFGASNVTVSDPLPAGITTASWTCAATSGGAVCGASSGVGAINDTGLNLPAGAVATYTLTLAVPATFTGNLVNTVTVSPSAGTTDPVPSNNTATDTNTQAVPTFNFCAANTIYNHDQTGSGATFAQRTHRFDTTTATESTIAGLLLSLPGALDVNALMIDPVTNRLITVVHTGPGPSQLWAYDAANGGWYAASPTFTGLVPRGGMNASGVGYLIGNGSTPPVWRVQASGAFTYSVTSIGALSYNVPPTDLLSGDLAFDGNGIGWLAVGRDLWTIDFSVAPLRAIRQQRPTLNGSPLAFNLSGIAFGTDGDLYVANSGNPSPASAYYRVDLNAGTITLVASASNVRDLASCAFPVQVPPELQVVKTLATVNGAPYVVGNPVGAGDTLGYSITIAHVGGNVAATLYAGDVVETLPANTTYVAAGNDFTCTGSNCPSIADIGIPVGGSVTLDFIVQVNALLSSGATSIDNAVAVNGEAAVDCAAPGNDCVESTPLSVVANLWITKTNTPAEGPIDGADDVLLSGSTTTYEITVGNNGPATLVGAILTDVTENLSSCALAAPACEVASGVATCPAVGSGAGELSVPNLFGAGVSVPVLQAGGSLIVRMTCTVD